MVIELNFWEWITVIAGTPIIIVFIYKTLSDICQKIMKN